MVPLRDGEFAWPNPARSGWAGPEDGFITGCMIASVPGSTSPRGPDAGNAIVRDLTAQRHVPERAANSQVELQNGAEILAGGTCSGSGSRGKLRGHRSSPPSEELVGSRGPPRRRSSDRTMATVMAQHGRAGPGQPGSIRVPNLSGVPVATPVPQARAGDSGRTANNCAEDCASRPDARGTAHPERAGQANLRHRSRQAMRPRGEGPEAGPRRCSLRRPDELLGQVRVRLRALQARHATSS